MTAIGFSLGRLDDGALPEIPVDVARKATLAVCTAAEGPEDARALLEALGLVEAPRRPRPARRVRGQDYGRVRH